MRLGISAFLFALCFPLADLPAEAASAKKAATSKSAKITKKSTSARQSEPVVSAPAVEKTGTASEEETLPPVDPDKWLKKSKLYQAGVRAMTDHLPEVAVRNLTDLVAANPPKEVLPYVNRQLGEAYVRNGQFEEGLNVFKNNRDLYDSEGALFWEGMANKGKGSYSVALRLFNSLENKEDLSPEVKTALLWQMAEIHGMLNNNEQSKRVLTRLLEMEDLQTQMVAKLALAALSIEIENPEEARLLVMDIINSPRKLSPQMVSMAKLILSKALVMEGNPKEALDNLSEMISRNSLPSRIMSMVKLAAAEAEIAMEKKGEVGEDEKGKGEDRLLTFIETQPDSPFLPEAFNILQATQAFSDPRAYEKLQEWARGEHPNRTPYAMGMMVRLMIKREEASQLPEIFVRAGEKFASHVATRDLQYLILQYFYDHKLAEEADKLISLLPGDEAKTLFMEGGLYYAKENFWKAGEVYDKSFDALTDYKGDLDQIAAYNVFISALRAEMPQLTKKMEESPFVNQGTHANLLLEKALAMASWGEEKSIKELERFLATYPHHKRTAEAWLALGELALNQKEPDNSLTTKALEALSNLPLTEEEKERTARLKVLLPERNEQWNAARAAAKEYLDVYRSPELMIPMQLKMGELLYRDREYNQAFLYIQRVIHALPEKSPYLPYALFLSGKAAQLTGTQQSMEDALRVFSEVVKLESPYKTAAIIESASILSRRGQAREVIAMLDSFMGEQDLAPESRRLALALEAEAWASLFSSDPTALEKAKKLTTKILEEENLPVSWKNRTLYQQAKFSEKAGDATEAIRDYHQIIHSPGNEEAIPEWGWYYKAGFSAMRLLEDQKNWLAAISLAETMAKAGGPLSEDAANRAKKIRLEHFVWSDNDQGNGPAETNKRLDLPEELTLPDSLLTPPAEEKREADGEKK